MFYSLVNRFNRFIFDTHVKKVIQSPINSYGTTKSPQKTAIVSQISHKDLLMYLVAIKSFLKYFSPDRIFVLDDMSLTEKDKRLLKSKIANLTIEPISKFRNPDCPTGGCWERLIFISDLVQNYYTIQLDSDTITIQKPVHVIEGAKKNVSFTLGTSIGREIQSIENFSKFANSFDIKTNSHVQIHAEASLIRTSEGHKKKYVRGCAGFAQDSINKKMLIDFSNQMGKLIGGKKWQEWGSEQVTSNYLIANSDNAFVLPMDRYPYFSPGLDVMKCIFVHFIGDHRFKHGVYRKTAIAVS